MSLFRRKEKPINDEMARYIQANRDKEDQYRSTVADMKKRRKDHDAKMTKVERAMALETIDEVKDECREFTRLTLGKRHGILVYDAKEDYENTISTHFEHPQKINEDRRHAKVWKKQSKKAAKEYARMHLDHGYYPRLLVYGKKGKR